MSNKIHTIQSSDKKEFDKQVNQLLELGGELMDGGYEVIKNDDGIVYSQVIVSENCELKFFNDGQLEYFSQLNENGNNNGLYTSWNENGQKVSEGTYKDGEKDGLWTQLNPVFNQMEEGTYKDGKKDGLWTMWNEDGQKKREGSFKDGNSDGPFTVWYKNGQKKSEGTYKDGKLISSKEWNEDGSVKE